MSQNEAPSLHVVQGGKDENGSGKKGKKERVGSKEWADVKRAEAKLAAREVDTVYMRLAKVLYEVHDTPIADDPAKKPVYRLWYETFQDYAQQELGLHYRKAFSLLKIWRRLEVDLQDLDPKLKERLYSLGWTKTREVVRVLTLKNAEKWVERAEKENLDNLTVSIATYIETVKKHSAEKAAAKTSTSVAGASFEGGTLETAPPQPVVVKNPHGGAAPEPAGPDSTAAKDLLPPETVGSEGDEDDDMPEAPMPELTALERRTFAFYPDQMEIVKEALDLAQTLSKSDVASHNLALICTEFLATNNAMSRGQKTLEWKLKLVSLIEKVLDLGIIAVEPKTNTVVYGGTTLAQAAQD